MGSNFLVGRYRRITAAFRWRLGLLVAAPELEEGTDDSVESFYSGRVTDCSFISDPKNYEHPRAEWVRNRVKGGRLLEVGCGNGGMTRMLAPLVDRIVALDASADSLAAIGPLHLKNVETVQGLVETFRPADKFDWIVISEVIEHLRTPEQVLQILAGWLAPRGRLLITTPNGYWESDEHLQEFTMVSFLALVGRLSIETLHVSYLRDAQGRRRWLVAELAAPETPPAPDDFTSRAALAERRHSPLSRLINWGARTRGAIFP